MEVTERQRRLLALCAIRVDGTSVDWSLMARQAQFEEGLDALWSGRIFETSAAAKRSVQVLRRGVREPAPLAERVEAETGAAAEAGARLVTVLDEDYPANLRLIPNLPPFLFYRGDLAADDAWSVAVVGTRNASETGHRAGGAAVRPAGRAMTSRLSPGWPGASTPPPTRPPWVAEDGPSLSSAPASRGAIRPRTRSLAEQITQAGALVSQFWPTRAPGRDTFPRRNVVTSGLSQGTVVIEASQTSGAKMQARLALEHDKKVFLVASLVADQPWARDYVDRRYAIEVGDVDEVLRHLAAPDRIRQKARQQQQLSLTLL